MAPSARIGVSEQMTIRRARDERDAPNRRRRSGKTSGRISKRDFLELRHRVRLTSRAYTGANEKNVRFRKVCALAHGGHETYMWTVD
ncbi:SICA antigen [Anopheles sinensis]|uniref:SICA antigen n=1 Tax=Anopheles sinensis TaxID=74873 RepID=A0A084VSU2_ANOSI|nr:SICA antigen [Anopheles sinensis]